MLQLKTFATKYGREMQPRSHTLSNTLELEDYIKYVLYDDRETVYRIECENLKITFLLDSREENLDSDYADWFILFGNAFFREREGITVRDDVEESGVPDENRFVECDGCGLMESPVNMAHHLKNEHYDVYYCNDCMGSLKGY